MSSEYGIWDPDACSILTVPLEVVAFIFDYCDYTTLSNLSATCKTLRAQSDLHRRYRKVDVSVHNIGWMPAAHGALVTHCWSDAYPALFDVKYLARKQHTLLSEVLDCPYIASLVHDFTWTLRSHCNPNCSKRANKGPVYPDTQMWQAFKLFRNVTNLDLACHLNTWDWEYLRQPPNILFPAATRVRLSGIMYRQIVEVIFQSIDLSRLEHLDFDNLQDPGRSGNLYPFHGPVLGNWNYPPQDSDDIKLPGTMRGILPSLQDQCSSLRSLAFRKSGWPVNFHGFSAAHDAQCYMELASFISSVALTLETFSFENGTSEGIPEPIERNSRGRPITRSSRPMDVRFVSHVYRALLRTKWKVLKDLRIFGVRILQPWNLKVKNCSGQDVTVHYEEKADRPCNIFMGILNFE